MGRGKGSPATGKTLATAEARRDLSKLVNGMRSKGEPSAHLLDEAIAIGPHRKGGAFLVPEVDALAHAERVTELEEQLEQREDDLEDLGLALFVQERLATTEGERLSAPEFLTGIGMEQYVERLPKG